MNPASDDQPVYIIDASIFIFRYYFAMPARWRAHNGRPTETVYGYANWLCRFLLDVRPREVAVCFDESLGTCFRNAIFPGYKSSRALPDEDLAFQLLACKKITAMLGLRCAASTRFEADDLIASVAQACAREGRAYRILTRDKDLAQALYTDSAALWDYPDGDIRDSAVIRETLGIRPAQMRSFLALVGDVSDDIPGVPKLGAKTAVQLLDYFDTWPVLKKQLHIVHQLPLRGAQQLQQRLFEYREQIEQMYRITWLNPRAMRVTLPKFLITKPDVARVGELADQLGFPARFSQMVDAYAANCRR